MSNRLLVASVVISLAAGLAVTGLTDLGDFMPSLLEGTWVTIQITLAGCLLAVVMALLAAFSKMYGPAPLRWLAVTYIEVFRGTSALVQLFWFFFVLPHFGLSLSPMTAAILALGFCVGAYGSEVVRGAVQSVPKGQWEAATALNLGFLATLRRIILPQAFVAMIPPWGNLFIELLKGTALVSLITIGDLTFKAQQMNQTTLRTVEIFSVVLVIYLALSLAITLTMKFLERRASAGLSVGRNS